MKVIMVMVATVDGKITKGDSSDIYTWTSKEDQKYFFSLIEKCNVLVYGRQTYEAVKDRIQLDENKLRIVLTSNPEKYQENAVLGKLEFSNESPKQIVKKLSQKGYKSLLLLGGRSINALFLNVNLVNELHLTLEPRIFGKGKSLIGDIELNITLQLTSLRKLNAKGTLLLKYKILK